MGGQCLELLYELCLVFEFAEYVLHLFLHLWLNAVNLFDVLLLQLDLLLELFDGHLGHLVLLVQLQVLVLFDLEFVVEAFHVHEHFVVASVFQFQIFFDILDAAIEVLQLFSFLGQFGF